MKKRAVDPECEQTTLGGREGIHSHAVRRGLMNSRTPPWLSYACGSRQGHQNKTADSCHGLPVTRQGVLEQTPAPALLNLIRRKMIRSLNLFGADK